VCPKSSTTYSDRRRWESAGRGYVLLRSVARERDFVLDAGDDPAAIRWAYRLIRAVRR
jgi:hypothetical protein